MSTASRQSVPNYPSFSERGYTPTQNPFGPPDLWPSGLGPASQAYPSAHGRHLAGVDSVNAEGIENYPNELDTLSVADDVAGNGLFDPNGSHGNVHPDEGVFADHESLPGYVDREQFYSPSEVRNIPGGGNNVYVPGGAVAFQQGQPETLRQKQLLWEIPPSVRPSNTGPINQVNWTSAPTAARPVGETNEEKVSVTHRQKILVAATAGVGAALLVLWLKGKK